MSDLTPDPSMDEILQRIERNIAEEGNPGEAPTGDPLPSAEVVNLTQAAGDNRVHRNAASAEGEPESEQGLRPAKRRIELDALRPESDKAEKIERLLSEASPGTTAAALAQLAAVQRERRRASELLGAGAMRTLEDVVREMLRPILQGWLDENLPQIIERVVRAELNRAFAEAGLVAQ